MDALRGRCGVDHLSTAHIGSLHKILTNDIDHTLASRLAVGKGVFSGSLPVDRAEHQGGRVVAHQSKEREWRQVHFTYITQQVSTLATERVPPEAL